MRFSLQPVYQRVEDLGGFPLHAALVEWNRAGVLLAASADTGKSTCCSRIPNSWQALCDDETLVVKDNQQQYFAHPFPTWSDYLRQRSERTFNVQKNLTPSAIFFLEQAENDEVSPMHKGEAAILINQSVMQVIYRFWNNLDNEELRDRRKKVFENACEFAQSIQAFRLRISLEGKFWEKIEAVLN